MVDVAIRFPSSLYDNKEMLHYRASYLGWFTRGPYETKNNLFLVRQQASSIRT